MLTQFKSLAVCTVVKVLQLGANSLKDRRGKDMM